MAPSYLMVTFHADMESSPAPVPGPVIAVSSNKGGVGKTTLATNLAIYARALREDLPVLVVGLDDQRTVDRMFGLGTPRPEEGNLKHGWAERSLSRLIRVGEYGVHYVPSPPDVSMLKARASDPRTLGRILECTEWSGLVLLDTKSDLEALTINALHAADRILLPISDWASLEEAQKIFTLLERAGLGAERARIVFTLVDRRSKADDRPLFARLREEALGRGWSIYKTFLSRSPRVESLNSGTGRPLSILHHARGTAVHGQMRELTLELLQDLGISDRLELVREDDGVPDELWGSPVEHLRIVRPDEGPASRLLSHPRRR
jgi:cellulose biosynthesis protein BcsQ